MLDSVVTTTRDERCCAISVQRDFRSRRTKVQIGPVPETERRNQKSKLTHCVPDQGLWSRHAAPRRRRMSRSSRPPAGISARLPSHRTPDLRIVLVLIIIFTNVRAPECESPVSRGGPCVLMSERRLHVPHCRRGPGAGRPEERIRAPRLGHRAPGERRDSSMESQKASGPQLERLHRLRASHQALPRAAGSGAARPGRRAQPSAAVDHSSAALARRTASGATSSPHAPITCTPANIATRTT